MISGDPSVYPCRHPTTGTLWRVKCDSGGYWCRSCCRCDVWMPFCTCEQEIGREADDFLTPAQPPQPMTTDNRADGDCLALADWLSKSEISDPPLHIEPEWQRA